MPACSSTLKQRARLEWKAGHENHLLIGECDWFGFGVFRYCFLSLPEKRIQFNYIFREECFLMMQKMRIHNGGSGDVASD